MIDPQPGPPLDADPLRRGDFVIVETDTGRTLDAMVTMASPNGRSLIVMFDGMIGGWLGAAAVFQADDRQWSTIDGMPLRLQRRP